MIIVSNTSPIHYLVLIGAEYLLPQLFPEVLIPPQLPPSFSALERPMLCVNG